MEENESKKAVRRLYLGGSYFVCYTIYSIWELYPMWLTRNVEPGASEIQKAILAKFFSICCLLFIISLFIYQRLKLISDIDLKILQFSRKFYSAETTKLCFEPIIADWKAEYSAAISQNQFWQARWISLRYAYAYLAAMFQQSWLGRLVELIQRIGK